MVQDHPHIGPNVSREGFIHGVKSDSVWVVCEFGGYLVEKVNICILDAIYVLVKTGERIVDFSADIVLGPGFTSTRFNLAVISYLGAKLGKRVADPEVFQGHAMVGFFTIMVQIIVFGIEVREAFSADSL
jgi:hypothetical protein